MNKLIAYLLLVASVSMLFVGCSSKTSSEACLHEVTMNLDRGNYDAVLASSCANAMQKGAAYFGKAGFDVKDVINNFSKTGVTSGSTSSQSDLSVYMTALVSHTTGTSLTYIDNALQSYGTITTTGGAFSLENYKDAQFYISMVDVVKSLSLIKLVVPNILDSQGNLNTLCDLNANQVPDDADATACALTASAIISSGSSTLSCTGATYVRSTPVDLTLVDSLGSPVLGTYSGLIITMTGGGVISGCTVSAPNDSSTSYKRLLYKADATHYWVVTSSTDICTDQNSSEWPCPIVQDGVPLDLVNAINETLTSSISSLGASLTTSITGTTDVQQAITDIQAQACCGCTSTPCLACTTLCNSQNVADYLQTYLQ